MRVHHQWSAEDADAQLRREAEAQGATVLRLSCYVDDDKDTQGFAVVAKKHTDSSLIIVKYSLHEGVAWLSDSLLYLTPDEANALRSL